MVPTLLTRVPSLKLLITSRQLLGLSAEREFVLSPLPVPGRRRSPEQLSLYDSVQLFIDRAQQVMPYFQVNNANAAAVAALVGGLEGIPLAIELAAARVQVLTPAQMLSQLSHRFDFLASRKRDMSERQRTLRGALEWSYRLLARRAAALLFSPVRLPGRLERGGGGAGVRGAPRAGLSGAAPGVLAGAVADATNVRYRSGSGCWRRCASMAQERLAESKEAEAGPVTDTSRTSWPWPRRRLHLSRDAEQGEWLSRLEAEHDNLRAALALCSEEAHIADSSLRICGALWRFWHVRGHFSEGRRWCAGALAQGTGSEQTSIRAMVLSGAGTLAWRQSDFTAARALHEESLRIRGELEDQPGIASSLGNLGKYRAATGRSHSGEDAL